MSSTGLKHSSSANQVQPAPPPVPPRPPHLKRKRDVARTDLSRLYTVKPLQQKMSQGSMLKKANSGLIEEKKSVLDHITDALWAVWHYRWSLLLRIVNITTLISAIIINAFSYQGSILPVSLLLKGQSKLDVMVEGADEFLPSLSAGIDNLWFMMYGFLMVFSIYSFIPFFAIPNPLINRRINILFILVNIIDIAWVLLAAANIPVWVLLIPAGLSMLFLMVIQMSVRINTWEYDSIYSYFCIKLPFSLYAAWTLIVFVWAIAALINGPWKNVGIVAVLSVVGSGVALLWADLPFLALTVWAILTIATFSPLNKTIRSLAWVGFVVVMLCLALSYVVRIYFWIKDRVYESGDTETESETFYDTETTDTSVDDVAVV